MAYQQQQQYDNYQQPRHQQQYYNQGGAPQHQYNQQQQHHGRQPAGYHDQHQYDDYAYDQGAYDQWDDGYYDQQGGYGNGQQGGQYVDNHARGPPQGRRPPPQEQYAHDDYYQQRPPPQAREPRGRPMRGRGNGPPPQNGRGGLQAPGRDRAFMKPISPRNLPQDNPFPTFPSQNAKPRPKAGSMDEAMSLMSIGHENEGQGRGGPPPPQGRGQPMPPQNRGPPPGRGGAVPGDVHRQDSGHFEGSGRGQRPPPNRIHSEPRPPPMNLEGARGPIGHQHNPASPTQQGFAGIQRSVTMPPNMTRGDQGRGYETQQQWAEPGPVAGYHGPESPTYIPPRPSTAGGVRPNQAEQRPPMPQMPLQQQAQQPQQPQHQYSQSQDSRQAEIDNFYDDYYGDSSSRQSKASDIDMPNFDAIPETSNRHRRGDSIDDHLSPTGNTTPKVSQGFAPAVDPLDTSTQQHNFYQQASRSRSQPDLHGQYAQGRASYEMAGDAPAVPALPRSNTGFSAPNGLPSGPRGRGPPPRGMGMDQGYGQQQNFDPRYAQQQPPVQRGYSNESAFSEPPSAMRTGSPMVPGNPIPRPGTAAPAPSRMPSDPLGRRPGTTQPQMTSMNPDALPSHPTPVRAGLMQQQHQQNQGPPPPGSQSGRPPPVRQYGSDNSRTSYDSVRTNGPPPQRRSSVPHPVTHDELNRLRATYKANGDGAIGLQLAKKLVEAATVLADEGGTADTRTRNKNREKFIMEGHKLVKKLVSSGNAEAMFYLADCYGQGLLGLQVDTREAFTLYQSAAKAGHAASAYRTAVCCEMGHEEGGGTKKDPLKAVQWYRRAAALGDTPAMYKMGMILLKGLLGQQKNFGEAINMLKRAADRADRENPHALHELGLIYEAQSNNERIIQDEAYAFQLFHQAAELNYKFSQFRLGQAYEYGLLGCQIDARTSIAWYTRAAAQQEHQSELALSGWYLTGSQGILEQSDTEAYLWARKAACAEPPLSKALFAMGYFTEVGIGCPRSLDEAKRWYGRAAAYKFPKAQERLEELKRGGAKVQMKRERLSRTNQKQQEENCTVM